MTRKDIVVFSGGSAANNLVDVFGNLAAVKGCSLSYIIPISDNGGSTSELIRVFGGPGIGDVRSRLVRLIPDNSDPSTTAIKALFSHRLSSTSPVSARNEWLDIVESRHPLWTNIDSSKRELIRSFFNTVNLEIVKRARPSSAFSFQSASVGNLFMTGARLFTGSFESAVYLLGAVCSVPESVKVIPVINSNFSYHISAGLEDGTVITGQNAISHPTEPSASAGANAISRAPTPQPTHDSTPIGSQTPSKSLAQSPSPRNVLITNLHHLLSPQSPDSEVPEDANLPHSHPSLRISSLNVSKQTTTLLSSPISRIWYINPYGQEIRPSANPKVLDALSEAGTVIYSIGSLYTSIVPSLILRGVGEGISPAKEGTTGPKYKILILNGCLDREVTSQSRQGYGAVDFVRAIVEACISSFAGASKIPPLTERIEGTEWKKYVSHVIYLGGEGTPRVERGWLSGLGIECVRVYGRKVENGMIYDGIALGQALEAIVGRGDVGGVAKGRRNTLGIVGHV